MTESNAVTGTAPATGPAETAIARRGLMRLRPDVIVRTASK
jgi:hypothetical protein